MAMRWEKKIPDSEGFWAISKDCLTIDTIVKYSLSINYRTDFYYCKLENLDIKPPLKELGPAEIIEAIKNKQEILMEDGLGNQFKITPLRFQYYNDRSYNVYTKNDSYPYIPCGSAFNFYEAS